MRYKNFLLIAVIMLFSLAWGRECSASYVVNNTGNLGISPPIYDPDNYPSGNGNNNGYTFSPSLGVRDSIVSYTFRARKSSKYTYPDTGHLQIRAGTRFVGNGYESPIQHSYYNVDVTSKTWSAPITVPATDWGANALQVTLTNSSSESNVAVEVEIIDVVYRTHSIDGVSLSISGGRPVITITNSTVAPNMKLWVQNSFSGYVCQGNIMSGSTVTYTDNLALTTPGKEYGYTVRFRFARDMGYDYQYQMSGEQTINAGSISVPIDQQLTIISNEIKSGTISSYGNTVDAVRDNTGTALSEARSAKLNTQTAVTKLDALQTSVTNIQNNLGGDSSPPTVKIKTVSGAMATSGGTIRAVLDISDNTDTVFTYSYDGGVYVPVSADNIINIPLNSIGPNLIQVWVKDQAGNTGKASITIRRL